MRTTALLFAVALLAACGNGTMTSSRGGGDGSTGGGSASSSGGGSASSGGGSASSGGGSATGEICGNSVDDDGDGKTDCLDTECFGNAACCVDLCTDGTAICDVGGVKQCQLDTASGCRAFAAAQTCSGGLLCSGGQCVSTCSNQCTLGAKQCASTGAVVECVTLGSGCTDWQVKASCPAGQACSGGACVPAASCSNQCTKGATRCTAGGQQQTCVTLMSGCTDWSYPAACATSGQVCDPAGTTCAAPQKCTTGAVRCASGSAAVESCDSSGVWRLTQSCSQACVQGACTTSTTCTAGALRCNGTSVESCNSSGTAWLYRESCANGCGAGVCTGGCTPNAKRCNTNTPEVCNAQGSGWTASTTCASGCYLGDCMQADLVIDGVTQTLEGDLAFANGVVVKNGGQLKVGPSGVLKLKAKTIVVDAASNINANAVGSSTQCPGGQRTCSKPGYCSGSTTYNLGACHGTSNQTSGTCYYGSYSYSCSIASSGTAYDRLDDLSISPGSKYQNNLGGGQLQLVAGAVDLKGQLTANGTDGASGGGILIAADTLTGSGAIQASGGGTSPVGGVGVIKLLRGSTSSFTGSVTGTKAESVMPPLDLVSGSHPDSKRWYNDGAGDWYLAWSKPFPSLNGYYVKASTSADTVPSSTAGQGTFQQTETAVVKASALQQGQNYFHIVSVDSAFNVGTVKATALLNLNTTPPAVSSSSHPNERTWYQNDAVYLTWTNPQDDANFTGYYYAFDRMMDTRPDAANTFTTNKQVLLSNTQPGIWVFHLVNRDTRGATTLSAEHFVVYVGTELAKSNLSGSVFDASNSNAPLSGVTIKVNRGIFSATSTGSGTYTFGNSLYVGKWEVTAEKAGYLPQTKTIDLMEGMPLNENFTLTKK
ncbi:MAG: hypothetical protein K1X89_16580 [Myxococcaceae bacterium]|nr:hypothetical protein [Myxococcaceae bacterium]